MFIDYVPLLLVNLAAGLTTLAFYLFKGPDAASQKGWVSGFAIVGTLALLNGTHMTWTWPLPGSYNVAFGELSVLFGILFLGAALSLASGGNLMPLSIYSLFAGTAAILVGVRIINLGLTREPLISGVGFILTGLSGVLVAPTLQLRENRILRLTVVIILIIAAFIWMRIGLIGYWGHLADSAKWVPRTMR